jgi:predicted DNA-binding transcriptional regulator YafY
VRHEKAAAVVDLARVLAASAEGLTLDEIGQAMGVGRRTAERMRDAVWQVFPQMEEVFDPPTKRFRIRGGLEGFVQSPTTEELVELSKAASQLRAAGADHRADQLERLERKVRSATRNAALRRMVPDVEALMRAETLAMQAGPRPFEDETVIAKVRQAVMAMRQLAFTYRGGSRPGAVRRVVPYGLMFGRMNYLVAAEAGSSEPRNWRLDRMAGLAVLEEPGTAPEGFSLEAYAARSFGVYQGDVEDVRLRISGDGAADALRWRFHPDQALHADGQGRVEVRFRASGMRELAWHLFSWGRAVEILEPESLRLELVTLLSAALERHQDRPSP